VIRVQAQQPEPVAVAVGHCTEGLADAQAVKPLPARTLPGMDGFPFQPRIRVDLRSSHCPYAFQCGQQGYLLPFFQGEQVALEDRAVQIQQHSFIRH